MNISKLADYNQSFKSRRYIHIMTPTDNMDNKYSLGHLNSVSKGKNTSLIDIHPETIIGINNKGLVLCNPKEKNKLNHNEVYYNAEKKPDEMKQALSLLAYIAAKVSGGEVGTTLNFDA